MVTSGYHILGATEGTSVAASVQAVGEKLKPWFWVLTILTFAMTTTRFVMAMRGHQHEEDAW